MSASVSSILEILADFRKVPQSQEAARFDFNEAVIEQVEGFVSRGEKIRFVMAGFPIKSMSRMKTLGDTPDMAEEISLNYLNAVCEKIKSVYGAGAEIVIYSDMFSYLDFFPATFTQKKIDAYVEGIHKILEKHQLSHIQYTKLPLSLAELKKHAETLKAFEARMKSKDLTNQGDIMLYTGLKHFCLPEIEAVYKSVPKSEQPSNTEKKRQAKAMAQGIAIMSVAHRKAIIAAEPNAIRLSAHAKPVDSAQLGAHLNPDHHNGGTPWHNAVSRGVGPASASDVGGMVASGEVEVDDSAVSADAMLELTPPLAMTDLLTDRFVKASEARLAGDLECTYPDSKSSHFASPAALLVQFRQMSKGPFQLCVADHDKAAALDLCEKAGVKPSLMVYQFGK